MVDQTRTEGTNRPLPHAERTQRRAAALRCRIKPTSLFTKQTQSVRSRTNPPRLLADVRANPTSDTERAQRAGVAQQKKEDTSTAGRWIEPASQIAKQSQLARDRTNPLRFPVDGRTNPTRDTKRKTHDLSATLGDENVRGGGMGVRYVRRTERLSWVMASLSRKRNWPI
jgi:hypothetical protein